MHAPKHACTHAYADTDASTHTHVRWFTARRSDCYTKQKIIERKKEEEKVCVFFKSDIKIHAVTGCKRQN